MKSPSRSWRVSGGIAGLLLLLVASAITWIGLDHAQQNRPVPVLMYHHLADEAGDDVWTVEVRAFERHLQSLRDQGYRSILPADLAAAARGRRLLPRKPVIITFDDGLNSTARLAEPLLKKYGFRAISYVITGLAAPAGADAVRYRHEQCLTQSEIATMDRRGTVRVGSHSHTHSRLPHVIAAEVAQSRDWLRAWTGRPVRDFCYPYGVHPPGLVDAVRAAGFTTAMICEDEVAVFRRNMDLLRIPRVSVYGGSHRFYIERASPRPEEGDALVFTGRNEGLPVPVLPVLVIGKHRLALPDPPDERLGPAPQRWRWPPDLWKGSEAPTARVELWDRHRILRLHP